ncbi:17-beta-hydroxysteroid dehydrogenase 14-like [Oppia nitens]|uniref:17-beta-hydroxysteroid dehydrogenase 14-like n=1 Tax=Oppia nitens TaxID=1686743 RepID=UPI0023DBDAD7|nr:17-beta-hydroxysteroid dehydrogenase 14-like [Oppia nitens]
MTLQLDFSGNVVLITGSSSGIGAEIAKLFTKSGANVVVTGRNTDNVAKVSKECSDLAVNGNKILDIVADVTKNEDLHRLVNKTIESFGKLDILVNNVGYGIPSPLGESQFVDNYRAIIETNLNSIVILTNLCVPYLELTKGNVVNMSSICGHIAAKNFSPYCITKAGLNMFTKCAAYELGPKGIRVNAINPGIIRTNFFNAMLQLTDEEEETTWNQCQQYPVGRCGEPADIANAVAYVASSHSGFVTGTTLLVDGGHIAANMSVDFFIKQ